MPRSRGRQHLNRFGIVYRVACRQTGEVYIGQTGLTYPTSRWRTHIQQAKSGKSTKLHAAMRKYSIADFEWVPIASALNWAALNELERILIAQYDAISNGYNHQQGYFPKPPKAQEPDAPWTPEYEAKQTALNAQEDLVDSLDWD